MYNYHLSKLDVGRRLKKEMAKSKIEWCHFSVNYILEDMFGISTYSETRIRPQINLIVFGKISNKETERFPEFL